MGSPEYLSFLSCLRVRTLLIISWLFTIYELVSYSFKVAIIRANKQVILEGGQDDGVDGWRGCGWIEFSIYYVLNTVSH